MSHELSSSDYLKQQLCSSPQQDPPITGIISRLVYTGPVVGSPSLLPPLWNQPGGLQDLPPPDLCPIVALPATFSSAVADLTSIQLGLAPSNCGHGKTHHHLYPVFGVDSSLLPCGRPLPDTSFQ
jgi:hypothetical protein